MSDLPGLEELKGAGLLEIEFDDGSKMIFSQSDGSAGAAGTWF